MARMVRLGCVGAAMLALASCGGGPEEAMPAPQPASLPSADFMTQSGQFAELQRAALAGDYQAFARDLHANDTASVVASLDAAFGGGPFDLYTLEAETSGSSHRRLVELRGPSDRLYLYLELDGAGGGWNAAGYELGRDRDAIARRL